MELSQTLNLIRQKIAAAQARGNRTESVTVVAASKTVPAERLQGLSECGLFICGEIRVQELVEKFGRVDTTWHMIGRLQTNKVKYLMDKAAMIQSLDRLSLAGEIERQCRKTGRTMEVLIEVNPAGEAQKGGIAPDELPAFLDRMGDFPSLRLRGLMAMTPNVANVENNRHYYLQMREIYDKIREQDRFPGFSILSMGMSSDYELAVECGSNMVRLGRALFGART